MGGLSKERSSREAVLTVCPNMTCGKAGWEELHCFVFFSSQKGIYANYGDRSLGHFKMEFSTYAIMSKGMKM